MTLQTHDKSVIDKLNQTAKAAGLDIAGGKVRRSSSRFCFGVEHGDYNGTELFGVGTDRFIWMGYKPNASRKVRLFSCNFPDDGIVEFELGNVPEPLAPSIRNTWARYPFGVDYILAREQYKLTEGIDAVVYGNIPGGGMSRSASLTLNLILSVLDANGIEFDFEREINLADGLKIVDMAQAVENVYVGSPCGQLDQIMILFAKDAQGTHYNPKNRSISYVPLGTDATDLRIVVMDTGTVRPGLETSTYKIRREECDRFAAMLAKAGYPVECLADIRDRAMYDKIVEQFEARYSHLVARLRYIYHAQKRFYQMTDAWKAGDAVRVGAIFRADGIGLRDDYDISGAELETMCDIARTVPGVLGERMLGGGDKGAAGALVLAEAEDNLRRAVDEAYSRSRPDYANRYAVHVCQPVAGITMLA